MVESNTPERRSRGTNTNSRGTNTTIDGAAPSPRRRKRTAATKSDSTTTISAAERLRMIQTAAYYRAERRGFAPGHEAEDWLAAEREIDALIASAQDPVASGTASRPSSARKTRAN
jgi:hypothetical protein